MTGPGEGEDQNWPGPTDQPERSIYAREGEQLTCENGHVIATFLRTVYGDEKPSRNDLGDWQQREPAANSTSQPCQICGKDWFRAGGVYELKPVQLHFADGWR